MLYFERRFMQTSTGFIIEKIVFLRCYINVFQRPYVRVMGSINFKSFLSKSYSSYHFLLKLHTQIYFQS